MTVNYLAMSLPDVIGELEAIARDTGTVFGRLDGRQLNWKADERSWSVAQCFDHLLTANREMFQAIDAALDPGVPRTIWQRMPLLPRLFGRVMVQSQRPDATRKFTAPPKAAPSASTIEPAIVERFIAGQHEAAGRIRSIEERDAGPLIVVSPFVSFITYSVLDGCRLIVAHERRHFEQARRVMETPGFPAAL